MLNEDESDDPRAMMQQARGGMPADRQGQRPPGGGGRGGQGGGRGGQGSQAEADCRPSNN